MIFFFRPTPHSSRQVVHHACKPVANWQIQLINASNVIHLHDGGLQKWTEDHYKVLLLSRCQQKKNKNKAEPKQGRRTKAKQPKTKQTKRTQQTNNEGSVISCSVHDVGNLKKDDSIVSSMVSSSGLEWRSNKTRQNRQRSQKPPYTNSVR